MSRHSGSGKFNSSMRKTFTHRRSFVARNPRDCGRCETALTCWGAPVPVESGFVSRHRSAVRRRTSLFSQGEWFKALYVVVSGCLKLQEVSPDGAERIVAFRVAGEMVGLEGWSRGQHPHSAIA